MQNAFLTIVTAVDGEERRISRNAEMELTPLSAILCYQEEEAAVRLEVQGGEVRYTREGDYSLSMRLADGQTTEGSLTLGGAQGSLVIKTNSVAYTIRKNSLLLKAEYTLVFGQEKQHMRLRINARHHLEEK